MQSGVLPDRIDVATHPGHRAEAHSMAITGTVGWIVSENLPEWQAALRSHADRFAARRMREPYFTGIVLDRRVLLLIRSGISCWCFGGLCVASDAGFFHPGVATCCLEGWATRSIYRVDRPSRGAISWP
jgi:hypothetical protein